MRDVLRKKCGSVPFSSCVAVGVVVTSVVESLVTSDERAYVRQTSSETLPGVMQHAAALPASRLVCYAVTGGYITQGPRESPQGLDVSKARTRRVSGANQLGGGLPYPGWLMILQMGGDLTPACNDHSICYETCNKNKAECDSIF